MKPFAELDADEQLALVEADARDELPDEMADYLREPENIGTWKDVIVTALVDLNAGFTQARAELTNARTSPQKFHAMKARYEAWKATEVARRADLEVRLREAKQLLNQRDAESYVSELRRDRHALLDAIRTHREQMESEDEDDFVPSDADMELWAVLESFEK